MKKPLQNSILGPVLILVIAALIIAHSWQKNTHQPISMPVPKVDANLPHSVLHYPDCDPVKDGKDCDKPATTPCYAGDQYQKFMQSLKNQGLAETASGTLEDGRQFVIYQNAQNGSFVLLAIGEDGQHKTEACQLAAGHHWQNGIKL